MNSATSNHLVERVRRLFGLDAGACRLQVAALPWRIDDGKLEVLLITSRDSGRWVLPKGWPEANEQFWNAAAREADEEAGLSGTISEREAGRYRYLKVLSSGAEVACEVLVYPLEVKRKSGKWKEKDERRRKWVSSTQASRMLNEPDLCELILAFDPLKSAA